MLYLKLTYKDMLEQQLQQAMESASDIMVCYYSKLKQAFTPDDDGVTVSDADGERTWTIICDFGFTGVGKVYAEAYVDDAPVPFSSDICTVNIMYPEHNVIDDFDSVMEAIFRLNKNQPYYFMCDLSKTSIGSADMDMSKFYELAVARFDNLMKTDISFQALQSLGLTATDYWTGVQEDPMMMGGNFFTGFSQHVQLMTFKATQSLQDFGTILCANHFVPENNRTTILCAIQPSNEEPLFADTPADSYGVLVSPTIRAYFCEKLGVTVNAVDFPSAAAVQIKMRAAIADMHLSSNATDLDKVKAIVTWMYENGKPEKQIIPEGYNDSFTPLQQSIYLKTSYGLLNNHFGDCMGWSDTFYLLCNLVGVKCATFDCSATAGGATASDTFSPDHRINIVWIDGIGYFCDVYWGAAGSGYQTPKFTYIGLTAEQAAASYSWRAARGIPQNMAETGLNITE